MFEDFFVEKITELRNQKNVSAREMSLLDKKIGRKAAVLIPSLLFGLVHIIGMDFSILSCLLLQYQGMSL